MNHLRAYQVGAISDSRNELRQGNLRIMLYSPTGCHARGSLVMQCNGRMIAVEDVRVGDRLMGDDGTLRTVTTLHSGTDKMAVITPIKGEAFCVNVGHILSLVHTTTGDIKDICVSEWLDKSNHFKHLHKLYRSESLEFEARNAALPVHPWLLGALLGDGTINGSITFSNPEPKIQMRVCVLAKNHGVQSWIQIGIPPRCDTTHVCNRRGQGNPLLQSLRALGLGHVKADSKFIPDDYKYASKDNRAYILAGLLDTDGHFADGHYDYISKSKHLSEDVVFIARSLGMAAYMTACNKYCQTGAGGIYWRVSLSGDFFSLPTIKIKHTPRLQIKSVLRTGFSVDLVDDQQYFGFTVDGNHRYLDSTFTVHHNSGKTVMGEEFIKSAIAKAKRVVFLTNRIALNKQTSRRFYAAGIHHGILQGENTRDLHHKVLIASIKTVEKRGLPDDVALLIIDEAHAVAGTKAYRDMIFAYNNVPVIGLSATPFSRGLGKTYKELGGEPLFQSLVVAATIRELIELGFLVDCEIYAPETDLDLSGVKLVKNKFGELDYDEKALAVEVDKPALVGNIVSHWQRMAKNKPTVCFATNIAHSKHICEQFNQQGIVAEHIDCYATDEERDAIMLRVADGITKIICNVSILREGWDFPGCEVMILARPTKSLIAYIQMAGRVLRPFEGKEKALILDHSGSCHELGYPTDDFPLELHDGSPNSNSAGKSEKPEEKKPKKCPKCQFMKPAGVHQCSKCGFAPECKSTIEVAEGELTKVDRKARKIAEEKYGSKQSVYSQLLTIQKERGYSDGWVENQYRSMFTVWPRGLDAVAITPSEQVRGFVQSQMIRYAKGKAKGQHATG